MKTSTQVNLLLCNTENGICETPAQNFRTPFPAKQKPIRILYFTDPICSSCLAIEPQLRKLKLEYGDIISMEYRMGGMLPSWDIYKGKLINTSADAARHWDMISPLYEMPIDGDIWLKDPLHSSYPPSIAFKATQMQDEEKAVMFLRRIREMVFFEKKNITRWVHLKKAAKDVLLDPIRLKADYEGKAHALFLEDLDFARKLDVKGFPTLFFTSTLNAHQRLYGYQSYQTFENTVKKLFPQAEKRTIDPCWENLFSHYSSLTTKEFSVLSNQTCKEAKAQLNALYKQNKIQKTPLKNGALWKRNKNYSEAR